MPQLDTVEQLLAMAIPLILAITLHEYAHGWMASLLGDATAEEQGRLSANPLRHIDPLGSVIVPTALFSLVGMMFGWAKPVPIDPNRLRKPRRDLMLVALAGPLSNILMAGVWAAIYHFSPWVAFSGSWGLWLRPALVDVASFGMLINIILAVVNLLPLPPLDGGRVLASLLPPVWEERLNHRWQWPGLALVIVLVVTGVLSQVVMPPVVALYQLLLGLGG